MATLKEAFDKLNKSIATLRRDVVITIVIAVFGAGFLIGFLIGLLVSG